ncbi:putative protein kinase RLK-Pelle-DLSV family [Helianthus annuus]|nr:putative protein kinase RLK-Pelle-DLSV family [Helianthus annuus]
MKKVLLSMAISFLLYSSFVLTQSPKLDPGEATSMKTIWGKLQLDGRVKLDDDLCSAETVAYTVICNCSYVNETVCHITHLILSSLNVTTNLPLEFVNFRHLKYLDIGLNYFHGTVPSGWATMRLSVISLLGNRLSGPFPIPLTRITTLKLLIISTNHFSGPLPQEIGKLTLLTQLDLSSNRFSGPLPAALAKLTSLRSLKLSDNNFTGTIPKFISQLTQIETLHIQGCSFEGPFPSSISDLTQLIDLRISDLKGDAVSPFPQLMNTYQIVQLVLRNCHINGTIPDYIGGHTSLRKIDLSFNNLTGEIPSSFSSLSHADIYLTANNLTGALPEWVVSSSKIFDVSFNQFTWNAASGPKKCEQDPAHVVESYSSSTNKQNDMNPCLRKDFPCTKKKSEQYYSLHINCGDEEVNINKTKYEADTLRRHAFHNEGNWAFSSTGNFLDGDRESELYTLSNTSNLHISTEDVKLYQKARTSSILLTYYGLCLMNGLYTVKLHFAEIVFTDDNSFNSLGKRVFDVYVQGELKLKDFDIVKEAGGAGIAVIKSYVIDVKNNTLKVQLYWAGKGTTAIPSDGSYGPIISAISVDPRFKPRKFTKKNKIGLIAGTVGGGIVFLSIIVIVILWRKGYLVPEDTAEELQGIDLQTGKFTQRKLAYATNNFNPSNKLGEGGFGAVYQGRLSDGTIIAVKQLSSTSRQGAREFVNEIGVITALRHPNLVRLYGCCVEGNSKSLVYEYMENNSLTHTLLGDDQVKKSMLTWPVRFNILIGIARGLTYLHEESDLRIIHRDVKASNILLDENFNAKISDFGLAKLNDDGNTHINTRIVGTKGYMAPEYAMRGHLTPKADVFSFGILALEIVSGISCNKYFSYETETETSINVFDWAWLLHQKGNLLELVDPDLRPEYSSEEALRVIHIAFLCTKTSAFARPTMSQTLSVLEGRTNIQDLENQLRPSTSEQDYRTLRRELWPDYNETRPTSGEPPTTESLVTESFVTESFIVESS